MESGVGLLLQIKGKYVAVMSPVCNRLHIIERNTARCLQEAVGRTCRTSPFAKQFERTCRVATTDKASANLLNEETLAHAHWNGHALHSTCDVHTLARMFGNVFEQFVPRDISGMIRHSLSLRVGAEMNNFRKALREEIQSRTVRVLAGQAPAETRRYRELALRTFAAHGRNLIAKRMLLSLLPNGDWRKRDIELFIGTAAPMDVAIAKATIANGLVTALAGCMHELYPRHRWVGADIAVDRCGLLCAVHDLGRGAYMRYMQKYGKAEDADSDIADIEHDIAADCGVGAGGAGVDPGAHEEAPTATDAASYAAFNSRSRKVAFVWWEQDPKCRRVVIRLVMEPARSLMGSYLDMAGHDWDAKQMKKVLQCINNGGPPKREFRASIAASNCLENECIQQVGLLLRASELWNLIPQVGFSVKNSCLAFRMLSRLACGVHQLLVVPHQQFPTKLFGLLQNPLPHRLPEELLGAPPCTRDPFSDSFLKEHAANLTDAKAMAILTFMALLMKKEIVQIEAMHASVRRWLIGRSVHTHTLNFKDLGELWALQRARKSRANWPFKKHTAEDKPAVVATRRAKRKRGCGGGGGMRAYFSQQLRQRGLRLPDGGIAKMLHEEYKSLPADEKEGHVSRGKLATKRRREEGLRTVSGFGTVHKAKELARRERLLRAEISKRIADQSPEAAALALAGHAVRQCVGGPHGGDAFKKALRLARGHFRQQGISRIELERLALNDLQKWKDTAGKMLVDEIIGEIGGADTAAELSNYLVPEPCAGLDLLHFVDAPASMLAEVAAFLTDGNKGNLKQCLRHWWDQAHHTILERDTPKLPERGEDPPECFRVGRCICSGVGRILERFRQRFHNFFIECFPRSGPERKGLAQQGFLVCQFIREAGAGVTTIGKTKIPAAGPAHSATDVWMHMGLLYLTPLRPTFAEMHVDIAAIDLEAADPASARVHLSAVNRYYTELECMERMCMQDGWKARFWLLEDTDRRVAIFNPGCVSALPYAHSAGAVWPPPRRERGDPLDAWDDVSGGESDDDDDDGGGDGGILSDAETEGGGEEGEGALVAEVDVAALLDDDVVDGVIVDEAIEIPLGDGVGDFPAPLEGGAAGSDDPLPVLPAREPAAFGLPGKGRGRGPPPEVSVDVPGGTIAYYATIQKFQATCRNELHGQCVLTRGRTARAHMHGKPCGLMMGWLLNGEAFTTKEEHWAAIAGYGEDATMDGASRAMLAEIPGGPELLARELGASGAAAAAS